MHYLFFSHFLMTMPSESLSDEVFCRYYLIFERYKQIAKPDEKQMLEEFVFKKFGKTKNFLRRNPIMMTVLSPSCDSVPDALTRLLDYRASAIQAYFVYLKNQVEEAGKSVTDFEAGCVSIYTYIQHCTLPNQVTTKSFTFKNCTLLT